MASISASSSSAREAAVEREPRRQVGDVALGDRHRRAELDGRRPQVLGRRVLARLDALDRLAHHLLVELVADLLDVAGLLFAQKVAGAAQVEVVACELEAGAERVERLQHGESRFSACGVIFARAGVVKIA